MGRHPRNLDRLEGNCGMSKGLSLSQHRAAATREIWVRDTKQLVAAIKGLLPGDLVILQDGTYFGNETLAIREKQGTPELPMVMMAEHQG